MLLKMMVPSSTLPEPFRPVLRLLAAISGPGSWHSGSHFSKFPFLNSIFHRAESSVPCAIFDVEDANATHTQALICELELTLLKRRVSCAMVIDLGYMSS